MKYISKIGLLFSLVILVVACGPKKRNPLKGLKKTKGEVYYGGNFHYNEVNNFRSLYPLNMTDVVSFRVSSQIYEGLVAFNLGNLLIEPAIAESWEIDSTNTVYTFKIRDGVTFHDDTCFADNRGRQVTAYDIKFCMDKLCEASPTNQGFSFVKDIVQGATDYYASTQDGEPLPGGVAGFKAVDNKTFQVILNTPYPNILNILATPYAYIYPNEAWKSYGEEMRLKCVGTGPFRIKELIEDKFRVIRHLWSRS